MGGERSAVRRDGREGEVAVQVGTQQVEYYLFTEVAAMTTGRSCNGHNGYL